MINIWHPPPPKKTPKSRQIMSNSRLFSVCVCIMYICVCVCVCVCVCHSKQKFRSTEEYQEEDKLGEHSGSRTSEALVAVWQEGGPLPEPETGLLSNTRKRIVRGDACADKARDFFGKGHLGREQEVREPRRTALPHGSQPWVSW